MKSPRFSAGLWCVAGISLVYWVCAGLRAAYRPFWFDELETWHIARLPGVAAIWAALCAGADNQMILNHLSVRLAHSIFGASHFTTRLPALFGVWIAMVGLFVFLRRRMPLPYAVIGMVFPALTFAWQYAYEARAYGIWMGSAVVALVSWQAAAEERMRPWSLVGITLGLAIALASHPVAVLLAVPFVCGEVVRTLERKRLDLPMWLAFAAASPVVLAYRPLLAVTQGRDIRGLHPGLAGVPGFYSTVFHSAIAPLLAAALVAYFLGGRVWVKERDELLVPRHEKAALTGFIVAPMFLLAANLFFSGVVFSSRYGIICVIGMAGWIAILIFRAGGGNRRVGTVVALVLVAWFVAARGKETRSQMVDPVQQFRDNNPVLLQAMADGRPVVANALVNFLEDDFYLPPADAGRLHYVVHLPTTLRYWGVENFSKQMLIQGREFPIRAHVEHWTDFASKNPRFLFMVNDDGINQLYDIFLENGFRMTVKAHRGLEHLYEVEQPDSARSTGAR